MEGKVEIEMKEIVLTKYKQRFEERLEIGRFGVVVLVNYSIVEV